MGFQRRDSAAGENRDLADVLCESGPEWTQVLKLQFQIQTLFPIMQTSALAAAAAAAVIAEFLEETIEFLLFVVESRIMSDDANDHVLLLLRIRRIIIPLDIVQHPRIPAALLRCKDHSIGHVVILTVVVVFVLCLVLLHTRRWGRGSGRESIAVLGVTVAEVGVVGSHQGSGFLQAFQDPPQRSRE